MNRINPEKLKEELGTAISLIDLDMSKDGTISNIIDRSARSTLFLLMSIMDGATEQVTCDEITELKKKVVKLQIEVTHLRKRFYPL